MNNSKLRALKSLVRIRLRRQESYDKARSEAQQELARLSDAAAGATQAADLADELVSRQIDLIDNLTAAGSSFQINEYLAQQDYHETLREKAAAERVKETQCFAAVERQQAVLAEARRAANHNLQHRERLQEKVVAMLKEADTKQMDDQDEEAEESFVARKQIAIIAAAAFDHAS